MPVLREERRIVTALFADVVGSTALAERLDPEEVKLVIGQAISRVIRVAESYGGTIQTLAGDGLLALFGAPKAHEDDAERAVRSALEIISLSADYAEEVRRSWGVTSFAMRLGVHTGIVVVGHLGGGGRVEYGAVGDTVNTAARLQAAADPGSVLVSEATYRQVAAIFDWGEQRNLELKGKAHIVLAFPVIGPKDTSGFPAQVAGIPPMVGRNAELSTGRALIDRLSVGQGGLLFIVGEPGIGKSRLAAELRKDALPRGDLIWLEGRCISYGQSLPYWPYRDLLRSWLQVTATEPDLRVRVKLRRALEELFPGRALELYPYLGTTLGLNLEPEVVDRLRPLSPESIQYRTFEVFAELFARLAADRPVVVHLDDMHWADPTSVALTERLLVLTESAPLMLAIGQRHETDQPSWKLKETAAREYPHLFQELSLSPLNRDSETDLLNSLVAQGALPREVIDHLLSYAEGNPFYLEQMVRSLIDRGALVPQNGHWIFEGGAGIEIPHTLEGVIIARIDRLEPSWRELLTAASVLGRVFGVELLEALTGIGVGDVRDALHHLRRVDLIREEAGGAQPLYRFKHALIQETAYRTLVHARRVLLHRRAAEWFESFYKDRPERVYGLIAHHWLAANDQNKAAQYLKLAGDQARDEGALDEAAGHYRQLIPLLRAAGRAHEAAELLFQLATTLHLAMRYGEANAAWQEAFQQWTSPPVAAEAPTALLRIAVFALPWETDPLLANRVRNVEFQQQLFDRLLDARPGPYVVPGLAERWEVTDDGRHYRFRLRQGLSKNDGDRFTAHDVVESIKRSLDPAKQSPNALSLSAVEGAAEYLGGRLSDFNRVGVRALDDLTAEFHLKTPVPSFIFGFAYPGISGAQAGRGTGPFRVKRMASESVTIERDPGYSRSRGGNVALVEWVQAQGDDAADAFRRGDVDMVVPGAIGYDWQALWQELGKATLGAPVGVDYVAFFGTSAGGPDLYLRKALAHATDRSLLEPLWPTVSLATGGIVPPGLTGHTPDLAPRFDVDLARRFLADSPHRGPLFLSSIPALTPSNWDQLIGGWRDYLHLDIQAVEIPLTDIPRPTGVAHATLDGYMADYPDPESFLAQLRSGSPLNFGMSYPPLDALLDRAASATFGAERLTLFHDADTMIVRDQCLFIPLLYRRLGALLQPWVHGWWEWGSPFLSYDELKVDERSPRFRYSASHARK